MWSCPCFRRDFFCAVIAVIDIAPQQSYAPRYLSRRSVGRRMTGRRQTKSSHLTTNQPPRTLSSALISPAATTGHARCVVASCLPRILQVPQTQAHCSNQVLAADTAGSRLRQSWVLQRPSATPLPHPLLHQRGGAAFLPPTPQAVLYYTHTQSLRPLYNVLHPCSSFCRRKARAIWGDKVT